MQDKVIPKVAVLLAAYNGIKWLDEQVSSILNQLGVELDLFVSVDLSNDGTYEWFKSIEEKHDNVFILPYGKKFGSAGQNFFRLLHDVDTSMYSFIAFADQDDIWYADKLICAVNKINQMNADAYSSNVIAFWPNGKKQLVNKSQPQKDWDFLFESAGPGCTFVLTGNLTTNLKALIKTRYKDFNKVYLHDWFVYAFARANGFNWIIDKEPYMLYRQHNNNEVGVNNSIASLNARFKKVITQFGFCQSKLIAQLCGLDNHSFVSRWIHLNRLDILKLALYSNQCRRKPKERIMFFVMCLVLAVKKLKCDE